MKTELFHKIIKTNSTMVDRLPDLKKELAPVRHYGYVPTPYENDLHEVNTQVEKMSTYVKMLKPIINDPTKIEEINSCYENINEIKSFACAKLKQLKKETLGNSAEERMNANQFHFSVQKFSNVLNQYDDIQQQLYVVATPIFDKNKPRLTAELQAVALKHYDIEQIAASLAELHQMLVDMAVLVTLQGDMLDSIEDNVNRAENATEKAVTQLQQASKEGVKYRKRLCCLLIIVLIILAAIIVPSVTLS